MWQGHYTAAGALYEESLAIRREMGDKVGVALSLFNLGNVALAQGEYAKARALNDDCLRLNREMGDKNGIASSLCYLGVVALAEGDHARARALLEESLSLRQEMDDKPGKARPLLGLGLVDLAQGKPEAREHILGSLRLGTGELRLEPSSLIGVGGLALQEGAPLFAARMLGAVQSALTALGLVVEPMMNFFHAQTLAKVKAALDETAFQSAWAEGSLWSHAEAVRRVLEEETYQAGVA